MKKLIILSSISLLSLSALASQYAMSPMEGYVPTNVEKSELEDLFSSLQKSPNESSICSNRAMVWSYELKENFNVDSMKTFIHYSKVYQHVAYNNGKHITRLGRFFRSKFGSSEIWVYHVAPSVMVDNQVYVLDRQYRDSAVTVEEWQSKYTKQVDKILNNDGKRSELISNLQRNISRNKVGSSKYQTSKYALELIKEAKQADGTYKTNCKVATHYADHEFDKKAWCHIQNSSMYYWTPGDLRRLNWNTKKKIRESNYTDKRAKLGAEKYQRSEFSPYSIKQSYIDAFDVIIE